MKLKGILLVLGLILFLPPVIAQKKIEMNLKQCLEMALLHDQRVKLSEMEQTRLRYQINQTRGIGLPQISGTGSFQNFLKLPTQLIPGEFFGEPGTLIPVQFGTNYNMSGGIQVSQLIYNQSFLVSLRISRRLLEQGSIEIEKSRENTVYDVAQLYYMALLTGQLTENLAETLAKLDTLTDIAKVHLENQLILQVDYDRISVNRANLQTEVSNLKLMLIQQLNMLKYFTGIPTEDSILLTTTVFDKLTMDLNLLSRDNHLSLREIDQQKKLLELQMELGHAQGIPYLAAFGDFSYNSQQNEFNKLFNDGKGWLGTSVIGLSLNVPIFNGGQRFYQQKQYKVQYQELDLSRDYTKRLIETSSRNALIKVQSLEQTAGMQRSNVKLADDVYKVLYDQYSRGYTPLTDLLSAESAKISAQSSYIQTLIQLKIAELELYKSNGNLMDILK
ncbi:MAG: TolC family protein [Bacteroidales bacterium]|nr:TolC family protein [Bacteroidales bacterium]